MGFALGGRGRIPLQFAGLRRGRVPSRRTVGAKLAGPEQSWGRADDGQARERHGRGVFLPNRDGAKAALLHGGGGIQLGRAARPRFPAGRRRSDGPAGGPGPAGDRRGGQCPGRLASNGGLRSWLPDRSSFGSVPGGSRHGYHRTRGEAGRRRRPGAGLPVHGTRAQCLRLPCGVRTARGELGGRAGAGSRGGEPGSQPGALGDIRTGRSTPVPSRFPVGRTGAVRGRVGDRGAARAGSTRCACPRSGSGIRRYAGALERDGDR